MPNTSRGLRRDSAGFTLIELMAVVAIMGILASIAFPSMKGFVVRSKRTERVMLASAVRRGYQEYFLSHDGIYPYVSGPGQTFLYDYNGYNPRWSGTPGPPAPLITSDPGWINLGVSPTGLLRYCYYIQAYSDKINPTNSYIEIATKADIDGDGVVADHYEYYYLQPDGSFANTFVSDTPNTD